MAKVPGLTPFEPPPSGGGAVRRKRRIDVESPLRPVGLQPQAQPVSVRGMVQPPAVDAKAYQALEALGRLVPEIDRLRNEMLDEQKKEAEALAEGRLAGMTLDQAKAAMAAGTLRVEDNPFGQLAMNSEYGKRIGIETVQAIAEEWATSDRDTVEMSDIIARRGQEALALLGDDPNAIAGYNARMRNALPQLQERAGQYRADRFQRRALENANVVLMADTQQMIEDGVAPDQFAATLVGRLQNDAGIRGTGPEGQGVLIANVIRKLGEDGALDHVAAIGNAELAGRGRIADDLQLGPVFRQADSRARLLQSERNLRRVEAAMGFESRARQPGGDPTLDAEMQPLVRAGDLPPEAAATLSQTNNANIQAAADEKVQLSVSGEMATLDEAADTGVAPSALDPAVDALVGRDPSFAPLGIEIKRRNREAIAAREQDATTRRNRQIATDRVRSEAEDLVKRNIRFLRLGIADKITESWIHTEEDFLSNSGRASRRLSREDNLEAAVTGLIAEVDAKVAHGMPLDVAVREKMDILVPLGRRDQGMVQRLNAPLAASIAAVTNEVPKPLLDALTEYRALKTYHPIEAAAITDDEHEIFYETVLAGMEFESMDPQTAVVNAVTRRQSGSRGSAKPINPRLVAERIEEVAEGTWRAWPPRGNVDVINTAYVGSELDRIANWYRHDGLTPSLALDKAVAYFKSRHWFINGYAVARGGEARPEFEAWIHAKLEAYAEAYGKSQNLTAEDLTIFNNNGLFTIIRKEGGAMVHHNEDSYFTSASLEKWMYEYQRAQNLAKSPANIHQIDGRDADLPLPAFGN